MNIRWKRLLYATWTRLIGTLITFSFANLGSSPARLLQYAISSRYIILFGFHHQHQQKPPSRLRGSSASCILCRCWIKINNLSSCNIMDLVFLYCDGTCFFNISLCWWLISSLLYVISVWWMRCVWKWTLCTIYGVGFCSLARSRWKISNSNYLKDIENIAQN